MLLLGEKECWASRATASQVQLSQKRAMLVCACVSVPVRKLVCRRWLLVDLYHAHHHHLKNVSRPQHSGDSSSSTVIVSDTRTRIRTLALAITTVSKASPLYRFDFLQLSLLAKGWCMCRHLRRHKTVFVVTSCSTHGASDDHLAQPNMQPKEEEHGSVAHFGSSMNGNAPAIAQSSQRRVGTG